MPAPLSLFAACQPGLEPLLASEIAALGAEARAIAPAESSSPAA